MISSDEQTIISVSMMQQELDGCYLAAEKLMALREPSLPNLESLIMKIECKFSEVMQILERLRSSSALMKKELISRNKDEFDRHYRTFAQARVAKTNTFAKTDDSSTNDAISVRSSASTRSKASSIKLKEAAVEVCVAQIKANHAAERAQDESALLKQKQKIYSLKTKEDSLLLELRQAIEQQRSFTFERERKTIEIRKAEEEAILLQYQQRINRSC